MDSAPVVVHRALPERRSGVTVRRDGREEILGLAYFDHDLIPLYRACAVACGCERLGPV
ncbi:hypothetical protein AB0C90_33715 [Streptomyces sp. NPDC048550]|uniref:hypothetical protein n=1 Tax=Streptomyces sp. NPDC048550 TaxID=3155739 RepID=UPI00343044D5